MASKIDELAEEVVGIASRRFDVTASAIVGKTRAAKVVLARQASQWALRRLGLTIERIGKVFRRDHSTVLSACRKIDDLYQAGGRPREELEELLEEARSFATRTGATTAIAEAFGTSSSGQPATNPPPAPPAPPRTCGGARVRKDGLLDGLPAVRLQFLTTPQVVRLLSELLKGGTVGRTLEEAAERVLCRGLEALRHMIPPELTAPIPLPYRCRACGHVWLAAFGGRPDPIAEYSLECPKCRTPSGEPDTTA